MAVWSSACWQRDLTVSIAELLGAVGAKSNTVVLPPKAAALVPL